MRKQKVVLGMSGGVDSSVAVHLLQQAGYEVIGVHMQMIPERFLTNQSSLQDAQAVARQFSIEFHTYDVREAFYETVIKRFMAQYCQGKTPNPCIVCNQQLKFKQFAEYAWTLGGDFIATGHYVQLDKDAMGRRLLKKGADPKKDQSYFLSLIDPVILDKIIFPLGCYTKEQVRQIARKLDLAVAEKSESQEICFIADNDYKRFLQQVLPSEQFHPGKIFHTDGTFLGTHQGIQNYTIGQRKGLGIALGTPAYVVQLNAKKNQVILGTHEDLLHQSLLAIDNQFFIEIPLQQPVAVEAKIRYRAQAVPATLYRYNNQEVKISFDVPQRAITPGQVVCCYQDDFIICGGIIDKVL